MSQMTRVELNRKLNDAYKTIGVLSKAAGALEEYVWALRRGETGVAFSLSLVPFTVRVFGVTRMCGGVVTTEHDGKEGLPEYLDHAMARWERNANGEDCPILGIGREISAYRNRVIAELQAAKEAK